MGDVIPFPIDHTKRADEIQGLCLGCDQTFTRRSAPSPIYVACFAFCSIECWTRWKNAGTPGMS